MNMEKNSNAKERMIQVAQKAIANKVAWMKIVAEGASVKQLREDVIRLVKLN